MAATRAGPNAPGRFRSLGDGQVDFTGIFSKLAQYGYDGWAVLEWECALKHPEDGAREGAPSSSRSHIIRVTDKAFDDFADSGADQMRTGGCWASTSAGGSDVTSSSRTPAKAGATARRTIRVKHAVVTKMDSACAGMTHRENRAGDGHRRKHGTTAPSGACGWAWWAAARARSSAPCIGSPPGSTMTTSCWPGRSRANRKRALPR